VDQVSQSRGKTGDPPKETGFSGSPPASRFPLCIVCAKQRYSLDSFRYPKFDRPKWKCLQVQLESRCIEMKLRMPDFTINQPSLRFYVRFVSGLVSVQLSSTNVPTLATSSRSLHISRVNFVQQYERMRVCTCLSRR